MSRMRGLIPCTKRVLHPPRRCCLHQSMTSSHNRGDGGPNTPSMMPNDLGIHNVSGSSRLTDWGALSSGMLRRNPSRSTDTSA
jgi:hypothetical protein